MGSFIGLTAQTTAAVSNALANVAYGYYTAVQLPLYTMATLPDPTTLGTGAIVWCADAAASTDATEQQGPGSGCIAVVKPVAGVLTWCADWSGKALVA